MRAQVTTIIRHQPDQSTADLARIVGVTGNQLRPQLRQLANDGVIPIEEHTERVAQVDPCPAAAAPRSRPGRGSRSAAK